MIVISTLLLSFALGENYLIKYKKKLRLLK